MPITGHGLKKVQYYFNLVIHRFSATARLNWRILEIKPFVVAKRAHHLLELRARVFDGRFLFRIAAAEVTDGLEKLRDVTGADELEVLEVENHLAGNGVGERSVVPGDFAEGLFERFLALIVDFPIQRDQYGVVGFLDF